MQKQILQIVVIMLSQNCVAVTNYVIGNDDRSFVHISNTDYSIVELSKAVCMIAEKECVHDYGTTSNDTIVIAGGKHFFMGKFEDIALANMAKLSSVNIPLGYANCGNIQFDPNNANDNRLMDINKDPTFCCLQQNDGFVGSQFCGQNVLDDYQNTDVHGGPLGTGVLIGKNRVLTAAHVVYDLSKDSLKYEASQIVCLFGMYENNFAFLSDDINEKEQYYEIDSIKLITSKRQGGDETEYNDLAILTLNRCIDNRYEVVTDNAGTQLIMKDDSIGKKLQQSGIKVFTMGHPLGLPMVYCDSSTVVESHNPDECFAVQSTPSADYFFADFDILGKGTSGSPVFAHSGDYQFDLVGIITRALSAGVCYDTTLKCWHELAVVTNDRPCHVALVNTLRAIKDYEIPTIYSTDCPQVKVTEPEVRPITNRNVNVMPLVVMVPGLPDQFVIVRYKTREQSGYLTVRLQPGNNTFWFEAGSFVIIEAEVLNVSGQHLGWKIIYQGIVK